MKFTINNFFKEKKGKIYFSEEVIIYEILKEKAEIFQTLDFEEGNIAKRLALYIKKLKNLSLEIVIDKMFFKKFEITAEEDEVSEENTEKYIEYSVKELLETGDLDDYFIKYFKEDRGKYIVFIFEREFIEGLVEFALENRLKIEKIKIKDEKEYILKNAVDYIRDDYDFIIIDCPPSLNMLTINAMTTADSVLVPIQCEYYALEGLSQLIHTIDLVQQRLNPELHIDGIVFTMYDVRTNLSNQVVENVRTNLDTKIYDTLIPRNIRLAEAPSHGLPINMYDTKSAGAESYRMLAKEVMERKNV